MKTDVKYRFSIVNFTKPDSLYTCGMKPVLYSKIEADRHFVSWTRVGDLIRYYRFFLILTEARTLELKTLEWWISRSMLGLLFFLISRLNNAWSPLVINLQINQSIGIKDIPF